MEHFVSRRLLSAKIASLRSQRQGEFEIASPTASSLVPSLRSGHASQLRLAMTVGRFFIHRIFLPPAGVSFLISFPIIKR